MVAIEEMAELQKELTKDLRGEGNAEHIAEEIADVIIMIEQLTIIYKNGQRVDEYINKKLQRLFERVMNDKKNK